MQAINPINTHTKFGKDRILFLQMSRNQECGRRTAEKAKLICPPPSGLDITSCYFIKLIVRGLCNPEHSVVEFCCNKYQLLNSQFHLCPVVLAIKYFNETLLKYKI